MYQASEISFEDAERAWDEAEFASLFCSPRLLKKLGYEPRFLGGFKNNSLCIVWPIVAANNLHYTPPEFSYYFGPFWVNNEITKTPYKLYRNNLEILNSLFPLIENVCGRISFSLVPEFTDLRPFQWWNYHNNDGRKFDVALRYTARYKFNKIMSDSELIGSFRSDDKRKKIRKALNGDSLAVSWGRSKPIEQYVKMYEKTISLSGGFVSDSTSKSLSNLIGLVDENAIDKVAIHTIELYKNSSSELHGYQLLLVGKGFVYAVAQCVSNEVRASNGNVLLSYEALKFAKKNFYTFDFNGANSPLRADDKHAYNTQIIPYFNLTLM